MCCKCAEVDNCLVACVRVCVYVIIPFRTYAHNTHESNHTHTNAHAYIHTYRIMHMNYTDMYTHIM